MEEWYLFPTRSFTLIDKQLWFWKIPEDNYEPRDLQQETAHKAILVRYVCVCIYREYTYMCIYRMYIHECNNNH